MTKSVKVFVRLSCTQRMVGGRQMVAPERNEKDKSLLYG